MPIPTARPIRPPSAATRVSCSVAAPGGISRERRVIPPIPGSWPIPGRGIFGSKNGPSCPALEMRVKDKRNHFWRWPMESADLRFFEAVARLGVMTRAAEELHTVQSNVTARIRALEHCLGAALFERHSAGVTLTDAGRRLLPYARRVSRLLDDAARAVRDD